MRNIRQREYNGKKSKIKAKEQNISKNFAMFLEIRQKFGTDFPVSSERGANDELYNLHCP